MYEMLGNQYFMSRQYSRATMALERALQTDPKNLGIQRKLIICYCQIGKVEDALHMFLSLIKADIDFIMSADPILDDCPCPDLIYNMEAQISDERQSLDFNLIIGMLWLFCDLERSFEYFHKAQVMDPNNTNIKSIMLFLSNRLEKEKTRH